MRILRKHAPSPALVVAVVALIAALGGTSYAALNLPKNGVGTKQLQNKAVSNGKLGPLSVGTAKIRNGAVTASKLNLYGVAVPYANYANGATNATRATSATNAINATNATRATTATSATNAVNATSATTATKVSGVSYLKSPAFTVPANGERSGIASCPPGTVVFGTGVHTAQVKDVIRQVQPLTPSGTSQPSQVQAFVDDLSGSASTDNYAIAICSAANSISNPGGL